MANESVEVRPIPTSDGRFRVHVRVIKNGKIVLDDELPGTFDTNREARINGERAGQRALSTA